MQLAQVIRTDGSIDAGIKFLLRAVVVELQIQLLALTVQLALQILILNRREYIPIFLISIHAVHAHLSRRDSLARGE